MYLTENERLICAVCLDNLNHRIKKYSRKSILTDLEFLQIKQQASKLFSSKLIAQLGKLNGFRRELRRNPTVFEVEFGKELRNHSIDFEFQVIIPPYILDFVIPEKMLVIEVDGSHHKIDNNQVEYDKRRTLYLEKLGFTIVRIENSDVKNWDVQNIKHFPNKPNFCFIIEERNRKPLPPEYGFLLKPSGGKKRRKVKMQKIANLAATQNEKNRVSLIRNLTDEQIKDEYGGKFKFVR